LIQSLSMKNNWRIFLLIIILSVIFLTACGGENEGPILTPTPISYVTEIPSSFSVSVPPYIPETMVHVLDDMRVIDLKHGQNDGDILFDVSAEQPVIKWVYALVAPFSYKGEDVTGQSLQIFWKGNTDYGFPADTIYVDGSTKAIFEKMWGAASPSHVVVSTEKDLLSDIWEDKDAFALLPFEQLEPAWKVLAVDENSPIQKDFDPDRYILTVPYSFLGDQDAIDVLLDMVMNADADGRKNVLSNRSADQLTTVVLTGVTAMVRGTAFIMEASGYTYPAIDIGDILREADILHISNEINFTETCPKPFSNKENDLNLVFCSKPEYIQLLEAIGTDVVEVTGDHFRDWGPSAMLNTLDMYEARGWQYYGGGRDLADALQPALFNHNGNKIAFFGCNAKQPGYANVGEDNPGALYCNMEEMGKQIENAVAQGYVPIFTFQHVEYYQYSASPALQKDFYAAADAGAVIVSGSQAHQPHALEFYKSSFLHYGLGNLFFDQYEESFDQRQAFIDRHVFYNGQHISTELIPIMFIDMARPRLMDEEERIQLLENVFTASGW